MKKNPPLAVLLMASISWIGLSFKTYCEKYNARQTDHIQASKYLGIVCQDVEQKEEIGASKECIERRRMVQESPSLYALYDVLKEWQLCGEHGCQVMLLSISDHILKIVIVFIIVYFLAMTLCGIRLTAGYNRQYVEPYQGFGQYESMLDCKKQK